MSRCEFVKPDGTRCKAFSLTGDRFCLNHSSDPKARQLKASAVRKGGISRSRPDGLSFWVNRPVKTMHDAKEVLSILLNAGISALMETIFRYANQYPRALALMASGKIDVNR